MKKKHLYRLLGGMLCASFLLTGCKSKEVAKQQQAFVQYGITCMEAGKYEEAVKTFQKALDETVGSITEDEITICYYKAEAQFRNQDYEGALTTYNALINYDKKNGDAYFLRGCLYFTMGEDEKAKDDLAKAVAVEPKEFALYIGNYQTLLDRGYQDEAVKYLDQALEVKDDSANGMMQKGRVYLLKNDWENSEEYLKKALDKKLVDANYYMAQLYVAQGKLEEADSYIEAYLETGDATAEELFQLGESQLKGGKYAQAVTYFKAALELEEVPNKQIIMKHCAIAYEKNYEFAEAREILKEYVTLYPEDDEAMRELTFLESR